MPEFICQNKSFVLAQEDLDRAPECILAVAWATSNKTSAVSLKEWPDPDLDVLEVVLGSLKQQPCAPGQTFQKRTVVKALDYFGVPISLWPQGFQLMQRAETKLRATAEDIIKQISALAATSHKPYGTDNGGTIQFCSQYSASQVNEDAGTYTIVEHSGHSGISLSERVRKAVVELGRADHLDITFEDHSRSRKYNYEYHYMVVKVYVSR